MVDRQIFANDEAIGGQNRSSCTDPFQENFRPGEWDVLCCGGKQGIEHVGNKRYRRYIAKVAATAYRNAETKVHKSVIVSQIIAAVKKRASGNMYGGFVKKDLATGRWYQVDEKTIREKVSHALRGVIKVQTRREERERRGTNGLFPLKLLNYLLQENRPEIGQNLRSQLTPVPVDCCTLSLEDDSYPTSSDENASDSLRNMAGVTTIIQALRSSASQPRPVSDEDDDYSLVDSMISDTDDDDFVASTTPPRVTSAYNDDSWERSLQESNERFSKPEENKLFWSTVA